MEKVQNYKEQAALHYYKEVQKTCNSLRHSYEQLDMKILNKECSYSQIMAYCYILAEDIEFISSKSFLYGKTIQNELLGYNDNNVVTELHDYLKSHILLLIDRVKSFSEEHKTKINFDKLPEPNSIIQSFSIEYIRYGTDILCNLSDLTLRLIDILKFIILYHSNYSDADKLSELYEQLIDDYKENNVSSLRSFIEEERHSSITLNMLHNSYGNNEVIELWTKYRFDIPSLVAALVKRGHYEPELDDLFDFVMKYEYLLNKDHNDRSEINKFVIKDAIQNILNYEEDKSFGKGYFFTKKYQWYAIYRVLVDEDILPDCELKKFTDLIEELNIKVDERRTCTYSTIKKFNAYIFASPFDNWNISKYNGENRDVYDCMVKTYTMFRKILNNCNN